MNKNRKNLANSDELIRRPKVDQRLHKGKSDDLWSSTVFVESKLDLTTLIKNRLITQKRYQGRLVKEKIVYKHKNYIYINKDKIKIELDNLILNRNQNRLIKLYKSKINLKEEINNFNNVVKRIIRKENRFYISKSRNIAINIRKQIYRNKVYLKKLYNRIKINIYDNDRINEFKNKLKEVNKKRKIIIHNKIPHHKLINKYKRHTATLNSIDNRTIIVDQLDRERARADRERELVSLYEEEEGRIIIIEDNDTKKNKSREERGRYSGIASNLLRRTVEIPDVVQSSIDKEKIIKELKNIISKNEDNIDIIINAGILIGKIKAYGLVDVPYELDPQILLHRRELELEIARETGRRVKGEENTSLNIIDLTRARTESTMIVDHFLCLNLRILSLNISEKKRLIRMERIIKKRKNWKKMVLKSF